MTYSFSFLTPPPPAALAWSARLLFSLVLLFSGLGGAVHAQQVDCGNLVLTAPTPVTGEENLFEFRVFRTGMTNTCFLDYDLDIDLGSFAQIGDVTITPGTDLMATTSPSGTGVNLDNSSGTTGNGTNSFIADGEIARIIFKLAPGTCATPMIAFANGADCSNNTCLPIMPAFSPPYCNGRLVVAGTVEDGIGAESGITAGNGFRYR